MPTTGEISLYFHIPFCKGKCPYCSFYSIFYQEKIVKKFIAALLKEIQVKTPLIENKKIASIYFGGGSPLLLSPEDLYQIINPFSKDCEITLEANPEELSLPKAKALQEIGINRLSIGAQSFDDDALKFLKRRHSTEDSRNAIKNAKEAGIENISIDLIYNLPDETLPSWKKNINSIPFDEISHISLYDLILEKKTPFYKKRKKILNKRPQEKESIAIFKNTCRLFKDKGLHQYEISAFAKKGFFSRHNLGYWTNRPFLGFGPAAFSYFDNRRFRNVPNVLEYIRKMEAGENPIDFSEKLSYEKARNELLAINLRIKNGVNIASFVKSCGAISETTMEKLQKLKQAGLVSIGQNKINLTARGFLLYDCVASEIV